MTFMKTPKSCSIIMLALASIITPGCSSVSVPPAQSYSVWMTGNNSPVIQAKSVRVHGAWVSMEGVTSPIDPRSGLTTVLAPVSSVSFILPNNTK